MNKDKKIECRLTTTEKARLQEYAKAQRKSISEIIRELCKTIIKMEE